MNYQPFANRLVILFIILMIMGGCKKFLEVDAPDNSITGDEPFTTAEGATDAVVGIYTEMSKSPNLLNGAGTLYAGVYSDELLYLGTMGATREFAAAYIDPGNPVLPGYFWDAPYEFIYGANRCLIWVSQSTTLTQSLRSQLLGEARFLRAMNYFYLIQIFGDVPLILSTDYTHTKDQGREKIANILNVVKDDLIQAKSLLPETYPSTGRVRANKWAAAALLAQYYLYQNNWELAEKEATEIISSGIYSLESLNNVFLATSREAILQHLPVSAGYHSMEGLLMVPLGNSRPSFVLTDSLLSRFEHGDKRKSEWTKRVTVEGRVYHYPFKYKRRPEVGQNVKPVEYTTVLRLAEIYLIRAKCRAALGNLPGAIEDLNVIRERAGLPLIDPEDQGMNWILMSQLVDHERQVELFAEGGHRWFDLKRSDEVNTVMTQFKLDWQASRILWPIPRLEITLNRLLTQNPGYQ